MNWLILVELLNLVIGILLLNPSIVIIKKTALPDCRRIDISWFEANGQNKHS